jgi:hypothetical protein
METVAELVKSYAQQALLDTEDVLELLLEFCADSGMHDAAITALAERIEEEGVVDEFRAYLVERGLLTSVATSADGERPLDVDDDDPLDLDDEDLE